jgi:hypothetical protein
MSCGTMAVPGLMRIVRTTLVTIATMGFLVFASAFMVSFVRPLLVETLVKEFVRRELETHVRERIVSLEASRLMTLAQKVVKRNETGIAESKRKIAEGVPAKVAAVVAQMQDADCECRKFVTQAAGAYLKFDVASKTAANDHLQRLIRTKYGEVVRSLLREFRIFTAANAIVFLLLGMIAFAKRAAALQLLLPAFVLLTAATVVAILYLFGQDWPHTILFSDYVGLGYFAYLGIALVCLIDVVFNHARITTEVVNAAFQLVGAAIQAVPC